MNHDAGKESFAFCDTYPNHVIVVRWIILGVAFALGIYILSDIKEMLGIAYVVYSLIALTMILPLSRCVNCFYYGKACNTGWGKVAAYLFPKGDESKFVYRYNYAIFLHLLWIIPLFVSFIQLLRKREIPALIVFVAYLLVLFIDKVLQKRLACVRCRLRESCPAVPFRKTR